MPLFNSPRRAALLLPLFAAVAACTTISPEARVRAGLMNAGVSERMAGCMAQRMVDRLSITQLRRLQSLSGLKNVDYRDVTVDEYLHKIRALRDPEIFSVTSRAALACAL